MNIRPIDAFYYNPKEVQLSDVITPPYDVIKPEEEKRLCAKSPYNFAHIIMPREEAEPYAGALDRLRKWTAAGILQRPKTPHYYLYRQTFTAEGKQYSRDTFLCGVRLEEFGKGRVRPHEKTHGSHQSDRLRILRKTGCNLSSVFAVVQDAEGILEETYEKWEFKAPILSCKGEDGQEHHVWEITPEEASNVVSFLEGRSLYIVDGHHRYSSALDYAKEKGTVGTDANSAFMFFAIANSFDPALVVYPTHRVVTQVGNKEFLDPYKLGELITLSKFERSNVQNFVENPTNQGHFLIDLPTGMWLAIPKHPEKNPMDPVAAVNRLSVTWSDRFILTQTLGIGEQERSKYIRYTHQWREALDAQDALLKIILPALTANDIVAVADQNGFMPQKSTYFYPKIGAGLVMRQTEQTF